MKMRLYKISHYKIGACERELDSMARWLNVHGYRLGASKIYELIRDVNESRREELLDSLRDFIDIVEQHTLGEMDVHQFHRLYNNCVLSWSDNLGEYTIESVLVSFQQPNGDVVIRQMNLPMEITIPIGGQKEVEDRIADMLCDLYQRSNDRIFVTAVI